MPTIRTLPQSIINQIAAGEVIERPAFAVKELIENALDAEASEISIDIIDSGFTKIRVTDNGVGMDKEDLLLSYQPHTTSKLLDDSLLHIDTYGFRGEALASLAAISQLTLQSKPKSATAGNKVIIHQGTVIETASVGMPAGTVIEIDRLFSSVPARKKFLKSPQTEFRHIIEAVTAAALSHPEIRITLTHNHRSILTLAAATLMHRIQDLLGPSLGTHLIPVQYEDSYISLHGFIGKPNVTAHTPSKVWVMVNHRPVTDKLITLALKESFAGLIEPHLYPTAILNLRVPNETIEVNVHPRKQEIHFIDSRLVFDVVKTGVLQTLINQNIRGTLQEAPPHPTCSPIAEQLKQQVLIHNPLAKTQFTQNDTIFQLHNSYLLVQTDQGLNIIDQHAAHERILFEQFQRAYTLQQVEETSISHPFDVLPTEAALLDEYQSHLHKIGLQYTKESSTRYILTAIPNHFDNRDYLSIIRDILNDLDQDIPIKNIDSYTTQLIEYLACKSAIKAGDPLTMDQRHQLWQQLNHCTLPYTCPHGRPTQIQLTITELEKLFKRG